MNSSAGKPAGIELTNVRVEKLPSARYESAKLQVEVLRTDLIHPVISGNKWFKLRFYVELVQSGKYKGIVTMGGAFSNHLVATAAAGALYGFPVVGLVRGEEPKAYSPSLQEMKELGMKLHFFSREDYKNLAYISQWAQKHYPDYLFIEEGGKGLDGIKGAATMADLCDFNTYTHILCAVGTGTMLSGLLSSSTPEQNVWGIPVLKISEGNDSDLYQYIAGSYSSKKITLWYEFHEGGYARSTPALLKFMDQWYKEFNIPSDFVYTGKLFKAFEKLVIQKKFPENSKILLIHSGGLQGNRSLTANTLCF